MQVKGMILAAGQGVRVRPLTKDVPKPMIPILGKPVMEYLIEHLAKFGVNEVMVNVAYKHGKIENYFDSGSRWGVQIGYSYEGVLDHGNVIEKPLGSAGGMRKIQDFGGFFDTTTIVMCGDALVDLDIRAAVAEHKEKRAMVSVITLEVPAEDVCHYGVVETEQDGRIISFQEKPSPEEARSNFASTGIYIFEPEALELIPKDAVCDIGSQFFPLLVEKGLPFYAQKRVFNWIDIGNVADYWCVLQRVMKGEIAHMEMPGREVRPGIRVGLNTRINWENVHIEGPVYINSGVCIEDGVQIIGPAWISHGSHIRSHAKVIRSVLFPYTRVNTGMTVEESIVSPSYCYDHNSSETYYHGDERTDLRWGDARGCSPVSSAM